MDEFVNRTEEMMGSIECPSENFSEMISRISLQHLGGYIRDGGEQNPKHHDSFGEREKKADIKFMKKLFDAMGDRVTDDLLSSFNEYTAVIKDIYFNMGMKAGAILQSKLIGNSETDT